MVFEDLLRASSWVQSIPEWHPDAKINILSWFFTDFFIVSAVGSEAITLIKYACISGFLNMKELKRNTIPSSAFGLTPVPNLGLIRGRVFIIRRAAHVPMPQKCPECGSAKVAKIVYGYPRFRLGEGRGLGQGGLGRVLHSSGSAQLAMPVLRPRIEDMRIPP